MTADSFDPLFLAFQGAVAGRYSIERELGRGGMGVVYLAQDVQLDRPVAIKLLPPERARDSDLRGRFLREARLAAKLSHPNIIPIHAVDEVGDFVFYAMTFVDGETLADRVRQRGPLSTADGTRVLRDVALALAHSHGHGIVHRDVKPDNVLLDRATGRALVADFGIAAVARDSSGGVTGTPEFMSPEQALGKELDGRSDVYSLGVTAYYTFSGRLPFEGASSTELLAKHVTATPPPLASLGTSVSRKVAGLVDRCMAKDPGQRPQTATAVADKLGLALEQRREMPTALRAFVREYGRLGGGALVSQIALLGVAVGVGAITSAPVAYATLAGGYVVGSCGLLVNAARRLLESGFRHADLPGAFASEIETAREEAAVENARRSPLIEDLVDRAERISEGVAVAASVVYTLSSVALWLLFPEWFLIDGSLLAEILKAGLTVAAVSFSANFVARGTRYLIRHRRLDYDTAFWAWLWSGPTGRAAFRAAERLAPKGLIQSAMTHRPTELSLGMAAEGLFGALPKEMRADLADVPTIVARLQEDARRLRALQDDLNDALADSPNEVAPEYDDIRARRDEVRAKFADVVGALETIRLNLLRLHAGSGTVESFTTHLGVAEDVSAEIERLLAASADVDGVLREFPRGRVPSPV